MRYNKVVLYGTAFIDQDNVLYSYDIRNGAPLTNYLGPQNINMAVIAVEDSLYVESWDTNVYKHSIGSPTPTIVFQVHTYRVVSLLVNCQQMYSGSEDWTSRKWNKDTGEALFVYIGYLSVARPFVVSDYSLYTYERDQITVLSLFTNRVS
jgi:hypothetical protein